MDDEARLLATLLHVSNSKDKDAKIANILFTRNEEGKGQYSFIKNMSYLMHSVTKSERRSECISIVLCLLPQPGCPEQSPQEIPYLFHECVCVCALFFIEKCCLSFVCCFNSQDKSKARKNEIWCDSEQLVTSESFKLIHVCVHIIKYDTTLLLVSLTHLLHTWWNEMEKNKQKYTLCSSIPETLMHPYFAFVTFDALLVASMAPTHALKREN